jgi:hypothetical protein
MIYNIKRLQIEIDVSGYRCKLYILPTIIREKSIFHYTVIFAWIAFKLIFHYNKNYRNKK